MKFHHIVSINLIILCTFLFSGITAPLYASGNLVTDIAIKGADHMNTDVVKLALTVKAGDTISKDLIEENLRRIYNLGYFNDVGANLEDYNKGKRIVFMVIENPVIKDIEIIGSTVISNEEIMNVLQTKPGNVYSIPMLNSDFKRIQKLFDEKGYILNRVTDLRFDGETVRIYIEENTIEDIRIIGNTRTRTYVISRELRMKKGEIYNDKKVVRSLQKIFNLGYFSEVKPRYEPGSETGKVVFIVDVKEQKTGQATIGGGYSSANGFVGIAEVAQKNWRGKGQTLNFRFEWGGMKTYELGFVEPYLNGKRISLGASVYNSQITQRYYDPANPGNGPIEYDEKRKGANLTLGKQINDYLKTSLTFRHENVSLDNDTAIKAALNANRLREGRYQTLSYYLGRDTRDNVFDPTRGDFHALNIDTTGGFLKGDDAFTKQKITLRKYMKLNDKNVIAARMMAGSINVTEGQLPLYEEYGVGGVYSLRGYEWREFLGEKLMVFNLELRHKLTKNFEGVIFFDYGDAWGGQGATSFDAKKGYGFGLNFNTPIGPIRLDYGKGKDRGGQTYFSMGRMF